MARFSQEEFLELSMNDYEARLAKLERRLFRKNKKQLIELGHEYGYDFSLGYLTKIDMVVELADAIMDRREKLNIFAAGDFRHRKKE